MKNRIARFAALTALLTVSLTWTGCMTEKPKKLLSEDIDVLTVFADDIAVLQSAKLPANSQEKYLAAKHLAEGVDFALTRNTSTVAKLFRIEDGAVTRTDEYGEEIIFYYPYQDHFVRIRFWFTKNLVTDSEVRIR